MVDQLVRASQDYSEFYQGTGHRWGDKQTQVTNVGKQHERQGGPADIVDEYRDILYFDAVSLMNGRQAENVSEIYCTKTRYYENMKARTMEGTKKRRIAKRTRKTPPQAAWK